MSDLVIGFHADNLRNAKKEGTKVYLSLFFTGMLQVTLVALSSWLIAHDYYPVAVLVGWGISFVWTFNVKKIAFGTNWHRVTYATGAACGTALGLLIGTLIQKFA